MFMERQEAIEWPTRDRYLVCTPTPHGNCSNFPQVTMKIRTGPSWHTFALLLLLGGISNASLGDMLPDFKECVQV